MNTAIGSPIAVWALVCAFALGGCAHPSEAEPSAPAAGLWNLEGEPPYLVGHYLPWFEVNPPGEPDQRTWRHWRWDGPGQTRDPGAGRRDDGQRDIASVMYPLIGPYNTWDPEVVRYHFATAKAAGVSAMIVLWYGPQAPDSDVHMGMFLDEAQKLGMRIAVCYEEKINWPPYRQPASRKDIVDSVTRDLTYVVEQYADHPAYLTRGGKPFIAQFNYWGEDDLGRRQIMADEWKSIFEALPRPVYYCRQNLERPELAPTIRSGFMWIKPSPQWLADFASFSTTAERLKREGDFDFLMTFVCPGFDDTGVWGWGGGPRVYPRQGLDILDQTMAMATAGEPELIQLVTWNDWGEGTSIEPSREHGFAYLDAIELWWGRVKGRPVDLDDNRKPYRDYVSRATGRRAEELPPGERD